MNKFNNFKNLNQTPQKHILDCIQQSSQSYFVTLVLARNTILHELNC